MSIGRLDSTIHREQYLEEMAAMVQSPPLPPLSRQDYREEVTTPTTPRPHAPQPVHTPVAPTQDLSLPDPSPNDAQRMPLPPVQAPTITLVQSVLQESPQSRTLAESAVIDDKWNTMDVDGSDNDLDGSDNDTENGDADASSRKKKGTTLLLYRLSSL